jgi:hypothetical protein
MAKKGNSIKKSHSRPILLMQVGPLHLFWTSAVFYLWMLKEKYNIIIIAPEIYKKDKNFQKIKNLSSIVQVEYFSNLRFLKRFDSIINSIDNILISFKPTVVLIYNTCYLENQLLLKRLLRIDPNIPVYQYQNGQELINPFKDYMYRNLEAMGRILNKSRVLFITFPFFLEFFLKIKSQLAYFYYFKIIPFLKIFSTLTSPINPFSGKINPRSISSLYGHQVKGYFVYTEIEAEYFRNQGINNVILVNHPLKICCDEVFEYFYEDLNERDQILIVPSVHYASLLKVKGWNDARIIRFISSHWISAFDKLIERFPNFSIKMKFHPLVEKDFIWNEIKSIFLKSDYNIKLLDNSISAELLVLQSRVIVGDISSVLWWAAIYGGKTVISLDMFDFCRDNQMKLYGLPIYYVSNLNDISKISKLDIKENKTSNMNYKNITDLINHA